MHTILTPLICMLECTNVHIATANAILQDFALIDYHTKFANKNVWVPYNANPRGPKKKGTKIPPFVFDVGAGSHKT